MTAHIKTRSNLRDLHVVIWDQLGVSPVTADMTVYWKDYFSSSSTQGKISLPQYVEDNGDILKQRFLSFVQEVGETKIGGTSTIEHLRILPEFSYWWMTLFACKRWSSTSNITEAVRLLALEEILCEIGPNKISLATDRYSVKKIIRDWCRQTGTEFQFIPTPGSSALDRFRSTTFITGPLRAIPLFVREILRRIGAPKSKFHFNSSLDVLLIDHFSRFDAASAANGVFRSGFWSTLVNVLENTDQKTLYLHKFVAGSTMTRRTNTRQLLEGLNSTSSTRKHLLLDAQLSLRVILRSLLMYIRLLETRYRIRKIKHSFSPSGSQLNLWRLFKNEWLDSLSGSTAMLHSITICELDNTVVTIPPCRTALYLMENQPWEMAFLQLWKRRRSEPLVGVPHSTIRYWDLRYFHSPGVLTTDIDSRLPTPSTIAVNGLPALNFLITTGIPIEQITEVEALAYLYLETIRPTTATSETPSPDTRLLVLGDFFPNQNLALLSMLQKSLTLNIRRISISVKPHPLCPIDRRDFSNLHFKIETRPLSELLNEFDIVLSTNGTSASAEAYQCGIPVITVLNGETPNFSPLRNVLGAVFVESPEHLAQELAQIGRRDKIPPGDYFRIDKSLPRWKRLLSI